MRGAPGIASGSGRRERIVAEGDHRKFGHQMIACLIPGSKFMLAHDKNSGFSEGLK
jgi:hypothetical protein